MFAEITLHNYRRPLRERTQDRKTVGPYRWIPSKAGEGRGFYTGQDGACASHGAGFRLRLEDANEHISGRLSWTTGYHCDRDGDGDTLQPIIARLPHGRGFIPGWTMGPGMASSLGAVVFEDETGAAFEAHRMAERDAEASREEQEAELERDREEEADDEEGDRNMFAVQEDPHEFGDTRDAINAVSAFEADSLKEWEYAIEARNDTLARVVKVNCLNETTRGYLAPLNGKA